MEKRYTALRIVGTVYKVLGIIVGVITILAILALCAGAVLGGGFLELAAEEFGSNMPRMAGGAGAVMAIVFAVIALIYGGVAAVSLYAFGEGIYLLLALEENTRATAALLRSQSRG